MRVKKQKRHRRTVRFFTAVFGFRQPFKVLCDGTFVHHLIANKIAPADKALANILGGPVKLFTTRCVLGELKRLGNSFSESLEAAHQLITARCDHEKMKSADDCMADVIGGDNLGHFFVATQDADLRKKFREVPGVPLIFALRNALLLEPASEFQLRFAKGSEQKRLHMTESEHQILKKRVQHLSEDNEVEEPANENKDPGNQSYQVEPVIKKQTTRKGMDVKDGPQFKRKKAKGPNPLSVKKKKFRENPNLPSVKENNAGTNNVRRSRKRKRSHLHKVQQPAGE